MLNNLLRLKVLRRTETQFSVGMLPQELFLKLLCLERMRTERSGRRFVLMLLDASGILKGVETPVQRTLLSAITQSTRDTDLKGWYKDRSVIGVIFTEVGTADDKSIAHALSTKVMDSLYGALSIREINEIRLSFHFFPQDWGDDGIDLPITTTLKLDLAGIHRKKFPLNAKRLMDLAGAMLGLTLCLPVFAIVALVVKLTSRGPALFRQVRLGQYGKKFTLLKFRSMRVDSDQTVHEEFVKLFIAGVSGTEPNAGNQKNVYKLTADPRITPVGRFLRKTSLDELPQLLNVLLGDISLVGPRPPLIYEFERYDLWHKQRLLAVKPGITGLWQVNGRSRVKFDDMVRMDIRYARSWSLWLDIKILLLTPRAVTSGTGAY